jgi:amino acid adenylation domain-containing protein
MATSDSIAISFEQVASRFPDSCALRWNGGSWSYAELNARANRLAHFLIRAGVHAETPVGVFGSRSPQVLTAFLAILKAGGAYVPLDPSYPADRINYYLEDAGIPIVLTNPDQASGLPPTGARMISLDEALAEGQPETNPNRGSDPHSLAHILYTSGSTGLPKGVLIEHRGVLRLAKCIDYMTIGPDETLLQSASLSFDMSTFEIWCAWLNGACLTLPPAGLISLHDLGVAIRSFQVNCLTLTASLMALMVEQEIQSLAGVRQLFTGADVVSPVHAERFLRKYPGSHLINAYGPTENTVLASCYPVQLENPMPTRLSIGRPVQKTEVLILNEQLQPVAPGEIGEMVMTGEGVARGYLNQPEATARSFIQVVDSSGQTVRGYRSGDLGRFREDGMLDFHGRADDQVKINGIRIEPGEIKNILQSHPQVSGAEVLLVQSGSQKRLEIFAVLSPGTNLEDRSLREFLKQKVPGNWLPPVIHLVAELPLNANGKVDRRALLASVPSAPGLGPFDSEDEPGDLLERAIWDIWRGILPAARIGRNDFFSELGGDSLSGLRMMAQVEKMIGRPIGLRPLLEGGTISAIAAAARDTGPVSPPPLMIGMQTAGSKPPFFFAHGDYLCGGIYCQKMAHQLGADQRLYAIAPHGTFGGDPPSSFEEIASSFVKLIRSVQPEGPYHLGGYCNGAVAIYEVAQQLMRAGETVAALVLLDPPDLYFHSLRRITGLGKRIGLPERRFRGAYLRIANAIDLWQQEGVVALLKDVKERLSNRTLRIFRQFLGNQESAAMPSVGKLNFHYYNIATQYEPQPNLGCASACILLREGESVYYPRQVGYWSALISPVRFEVIPGTHSELQTRMGEIAPIIKAALAS